MGARRRGRRRLAAVVGAAIAVTGFGIGASPASAAPEAYFSPVEGNIAVKGSPAEFSGVTIEGTYDAETGDLTARATFPKTTQVRENQPAPGNNAEVVIQVSQPEPAVGTVSETGEVELDAVFQMVIESVTLVNQETGARTPIPLGPTPDSCRFHPIEVDLRGTATGAEGGPLTVSVADDEFTIPEPANAATDCGPLGALIWPNVAGTGNSAELSFVLSSAQAQVEAIYQAVLGRSAEPDGLAYWAGRIQSGLSPTRVAMTIARSREGWALAVGDSYQIALDREADEDGLDWWTDALVRAQDQPFLIGRLLSSAEANRQAEEAFPEAASSNEAFVRNLYPTLFGRDADEGGVAFWTARLDAADNVAVARTSLAQRLYRNTETVTYAVDNASQAVCGTPAAGEQASTLAEAFIASNYHTRVLLAIAAITPCPVVETVEG